MIGHKIIHLDTVDSTNNYTAKLVRSGELQSGAVILTDEQFAGRGQRGNSWESEAGNNLLSSCYVEHDNLSVEHQFRLSQWVSLALCELLAHLRIEAKIKWPNDIYVGNRKIAGVLIENSIGSKGVNFSIIGVGLNVNQIDFSIPRATSVRQETGQHYLIDTILYSYINALNKFHDLLNHPDQLQQLYLERMYKRNEFQTFLIDGREVVGKIVTVTSLGRLVVALDDDQLMEYDIQEISFVFD
jgi:BirA family biotin operon repressor/biotin-[acetyl-CoA-carboxylase] ligase